MEPPQLFGVYMIQKITLDKKNEDNTFQINSGAKCFTLMAQRGLLSKETSRMTPERWESKFLLMGSSWNCVIVAEDEIIEY